jgi:hypothetical protein
MSVFPRIDPDHPLAQAARATNAVAEERGLDATLEWLGIGEVGEIAYLAEQRALRAVAASVAGVNLGADGPLAAEQIALAVQSTPLWQDFRALLLSCYLDGFCIGYKGHEIATRDDTPSDGVN